MSDNKFTSLSSIVLIIIKELRISQGIHQAQLADSCGKTPSAWTKIETGKSPLTMDIMFRVCHELRVTPSAIFSTAERYTSLFSQYGWAILYNYIQQKEDEDLLLKEASEYYKNYQPSYWNILNTPYCHINGSVYMAPVFQFVLDENFRFNVLNNKNFLGVKYS